MTIRYYMSTDRTEEMLISSDNGVEAVHLKRDGQDVLVWRLDAGGLSLTAPTGSLPQLLTDNGITGPAQHERLKSAIQNKKLALQEVPFSDPDFLSDANDAGEFGI